MSRHSLPFALCVMTLVLLPPGVEETYTEGARTAAATLTKVAARLDSRAGIVTIEASAPVAYVAVQPDARTTVVEMRGVDAAGVANEIATDAQHPADTIRVERGTAADGAAVARVRISFREPIRPRVRSSRNVIFVEADRLEAGAVDRTMQIAAPAAAIRDLRVTQRGTATAVTLLGTAPLVAGGVEEPAEGPRRVVLTLPNATSAVPATTPVRQGPVQNVHIGMSPTPPFATQVTMALSRAASYRLETSPNGNDLMVVFDDPAPDPIEALRTRTAPVGPAASPQAAPAPQAAPLLQAPAAPAAQDPPAPAPVSEAQPDAPQFTGAPISLALEDADLRGVLSFLGSEIGGLNLYLDPRVQGTVTVNLTAIPWDEAFDLIASSSGVGYVRRGNVVRVAPMAVLAEEEAARRKLDEERALAGELRTATRTLSYATAQQLAATIEEIILSPRGTVEIDQRTNTIIITDLVDRLDRASELITTLDRPQPQVEIEARIVQTNRDFARAIGVQLGASARASSDLGNTIPTPFPNSGSISGRAGPGQGPGGTPTAVNLGVEDATSAIGLMLASINGAINLDAQLSALERSGRGKILSTPRVFTLNNVEAEIKQGVQIPIPTIANNTVTVQFRDAALILRVLPQITAANTVSMRIAVENAAPDFSREVNNIPPIDTQSATTTVLVADGETTVIGGIYVSREQAAQSRTPGLSSIPLLGWLFKRTEISDESRELLIFITPRIIRL